MKKSLFSIMNKLSPKIQCILKKVSLQELEMVQEIRLRLSKPLSVCILNKEYFITNRGVLTQNTSDGIVLIDRNDIEFVFNIACQYSIHSFQKELAQGYITLEGGNRMGICGTAVIINGKIETIKDISSLNIRIAREVMNCSSQIYNMFFRNKLNSVLIIGPPSSGKTTILRDLCRNIGNNTKLAIIDERNEISATVNSIPQNDIGLCSDVFNSYPKKEGIMIAIRVMSPKVIVCDEIGNDSDVDALLNALHSGVKIVATAHSDSYEDILKRGNIAKLLEQGAFDYVIELDNGKNVGKVKRTCKMEDFHA